MEPFSLPAFAKINLDLRILGMRGDGYHDVRTILQTLAVHDTLTFIPRKGSFVIHCDDPEVPTDRRNLVWQAASLLWQTAGTRRGTTPRDAIVEIQKSIPPQAGLGGGSGRLVLSGIRVSVANDVESAYRRVGMTPIRTQSREGWVALTFHASW